MVALPERLHAQPVPTVLVVKRVRARKRHLCATGGRAQRVLGGTQGTQCSGRRVLCGSRPARGATTYLDVAALEREVEARLLVLDEMQRNLVAPHPPVSTREYRLVAQEPSPSRVPMSGCAGTGGYSTGTDWLVLSTSGKPFCCR